VAHPSRPPRSRTTARDRPFRTSRDSFRCLRIRAAAQAFNPDETQKGQIEMNLVAAGLVGLAFLILFAIFLISVRRAERDVDYAAFGSERHNDNLGLVARVVANVIVSSP